MRASQSTNLLAQQAAVLRNLLVQTVHILVWPCSKDRKLLKTLKFPKEYDLKVTLKAVNWEVMKSWIAKRVTELLGLEDEVVIGYIYEQLEGKDVRCHDFLYERRGSPSSGLVLHVPQHDNVPVCTDD